MIIKVAYDYPQARVVRTYLVSSYFLPGAANTCRVDGQRES